jgi:DNA-binding phage protein
MPKKLETYPWDPVEFLKTEKDITEYLEAAREENDPALLDAVRQDVERARRSWLLKEKK